MRSIYFLLLVASTSCQFATLAQNEKPRIVTCNNDSLQIVGRVKPTGDSIAIYWPGTSVEISFKGTALEAILMDETGKNFFNVEVDGKFSSLIHVDPTKKLYSLATGLSDTQHTIRLIKRTEWDQGKTWFYGFTLHGILMKNRPKSRVIEFFGDSITAGYAIEDSTGTDSPVGKNTNNYNTYASLTSRHFNADCYLTIKSGIGVMISWFPLTMPQLYNRLDPADSSSRWNFSVQPQVVVINLFQNDSWLIEKPEHPSFIATFGKTKPNSEFIIRAYESFISRVRAEYPQAFIICSLGSMDATKESGPWRQYIEAAVKRLDDKRVATCFFPYIQRSGHPTESDNKVMGDSLIEFIHAKVGW